METTKNITKENPYISVAEAARLLNISPPSIYQYLSQGVIPGENVIIGGWKIRRTDVTKLTKGDKLLKVEQVSKMMNMPRATIYHHIHRTSVMAGAWIKLGSRYRFRRKAIVSIMSENLMMDTETVVVGEDPAERDILIRKFRDNGRDCLGATTLREVGQMDQIPKFIIFTEGATSTDVQYAVERLEARVMVVREPGDVALFQGAPVLHGTLQQVTTNQFIDALYAHAS